MLLGILVPIFNPHDTDLSPCYNLRWYNRLDGHLGGCLEGLLDGHLDSLLDGCPDGHPEGCLNSCLEACLDGRLDGRVDGHRDPVRLRHQVTIDVTKVRLSTDTIRLTIR